MATIREGNRPVLVVVDARAGMMADCRDAARMVDSIAAVVGRARAARTRHELTPLDFTRPGRKA